MDDAPTARTALIVGGGIGGMSLAICLARIGYSVDLVDIDPDWRAVGAGLTLNSASLRAFERVGLLDELRVASDIHSGMMLYDVGGRLILDGSLDPGPRAEVGGILRPVLHRIMANAALASGTRVQLGQSVEALDQSEKAVRVRFTDGKTGNYGLVIGADGVHSAVRKTIFPDAPDPTFTGQGCWRAVFPRPASVRTSELYLDSFHKAGLNPVSREEMYMFLLESVPPSAKMPPERWRKLLRERMKPFGGRIAELRERLDENARINYRPLEKLMLPPPWHIGRVLLIGDAVHATTPHCAYGAGLAVEDAVVLAELLADGMEIEAAMPRFVARRYERCRHVVEGSCLLGELEMSHAPVDEHRRVSNEMASFIAQPI